MEVTPLSSDVPNSYIVINGADYDDDDNDDYQDDNDDDDDEPEKWKLNPFIWCTKIHT